MAGGNNRAERSGILAADGGGERAVNDEYRRLTELRLAQLFFRTAAAKLEKVVAKNACSLLEHPSNDGIRVGEIGAHSNYLRTLPGENNSDAWRGHYAAHRHATAPHERPAPNPVKTIKSSLRSFCSRSASDSAIGIDAALVFPYSWILTMTFSAGIES